MDRPTEAELRQRIAAGSQEPDDYGRLADILAVGGQTQAAIDVLERALTLPLGRLGRAEVLAGLGWRLYEYTKHNDRARSLGEEGIALLAGEVDTPAVLLVRGAHQSLVAHCHWRSDEAAAAPDAARAALVTFERLLAEQPDHQDAWLEAARLYTALQGVDRAIPLCERYLGADLEPLARLDGLLTLGEAYRLAGRLSEAEAAAIEGVRLASAHRQVLHNACHFLGLVQQATGRPGEARRSFEQALVALTGDPLLRDDADWRKSLHGRLAEVFSELGEHAQAASSWRDLLNWYTDADPARARVLVCLGDACYHAGAFAEARAAYEAVVADPRAPDEDQAAARVWAVWSAGEIHQVAGEYAEALRVFESLLPYYPNDDADRHVVLRRLAYCHSMLGDFARAREHYEAVLASPHTTDIEKADVLDRVERIEARRLYEAGRYAEAAQGFERVLERLSARDAEWCGWLLCLADCYWKMGACTAARDCYEEILRAPRATQSEKADARRSLEALKRQR